MANGYVAWQGMSAITDEEAIKRINDLGYSFSEQQNSVLNTKGSMVVSACAGSGKTHTVIGLVAKRILTGEISNPSSCLLTTFSRAGKSNMEERLSTMLTMLGYGGSGVSVRTMHSIYSQFLWKWFKSQPNIILDAQRNVYLAKAAKVWKNVLSDEELNSLSSLMTYQINNLMPLDKLYKSYVFDLEMDLNTFVSIHKTFYELKKLDNVYDFDDMQYNVYWALYESEPQYRNYFYSLIRSFTDIYVDEFQDTSLVQYKILQAMITDPSKIVVCGDDDQCIYGWRGSMPKLLLNITADYPCIQKRYLETNYRCQENVLALARSGTKYITMRESKGMNSAKSGGEVNFIFSNMSNLYQAAQDTAFSIDELLKTGVEPKDIVVLCRQNSVLHTLILELIDRGHWLSAETKVTKSPFFKDIVTLHGMVTNESAVASSEIKAVLWKLIRFFGYKNAELITKVMQSTGFDLLAVLGVILSQRRFLGPEWNIEIQNKRQQSTINMMADSLSIDTLSSMQTMHEILMGKDQTEKLLKLLAIYYSGIEFMSKKPNKIRQTAGMYTLFSDKLKNKGIEWLGQFLLIVKSIESAPMETFVNNLHLSTIHGVKGLEWKHVFIYSYDNYCFPNSNYIAEKGGLVTTDLTEYLDEERRLAYVACTRAIEQLHIVTDNLSVSYLLLEQLNRLWQQEVGVQTTQGFVTLCQSFDSMNMNPDYLRISAEQAKQALDALYSPNNTITE